MALGDTKTSSVHVSFGLTVLNLLLTLSTLSFSCFQWHDLKWRVEKLESIVPLQDPNRGYGHIIFTPTTPNTVNFGSRTRNVVKRAIKSSRDQRKNMCAKVCLLCTVSILG